MDNETENRIISSLSSQGADIAWIKAEVSDIKTNCLATMRGEIGELKVSMNKRPQVWTSALITILCSTLVGLVVYLLTHISD